VLAAVDRLDAIKCDRGAHALLECHTPRDVFELFDGLGYRGERVADGINYAFRL
jgi:hypothetical protein